MSAATFLGALMVLALVVAPARAIPTFFTKGPYLQELSPTAVTVRFELETKGTASVELTQEGKPPIVVSDRDEATFHSIRVEKLEPATHYQYVVRSLGAVSAKGEITTAPADAASAPFTFLIYGDNRSDDAAHAVVVRAMKQAPADFFVHTGDFVQSGGNARDWQSFFEVESPLLRDRCVFSCVGNHELYEDSAAAAYARYFGPSSGAASPKLYGTMRWSNARFFFLNAFDDWSRGEARAWLEKELASADVEPGLVWRFVVLHHGAWSSGPHGSSPKLAAGGVPALFAAHKIDLLVSGHDHVYERGEASGVRYIVSGGGGAPLYRQNKPLASTRKFEATYHFVEVAVAAEGVKLVAKRVDGSTVERTGFSKLAGWDGDPMPATPASGPLAPSPKLVPPPEPAPSTSSRCGCVAAGAPRPLFDGLVGVGAALATIALSLFRARRQRR